MNTKWKVILSVMCLIITICGVFTTIVLQQHNDKIVGIIQGKTESSSILSERISAQIADTYQQRIRLFINPAISRSREKMIQAFANRDRDTLFKLSNPFFTAFKKEFPSFSTMAWILPDNHIFLRVQKPEKYGDDISKTRPDIAAVNLEKRPHSGFNAGLMSMQYRVVQPVFYNDTYIGSVQFGIEAKVILETLQNALHTMAGMAVFNEEWETVIYPNSPILKGETHTIVAKDVTVFATAKNQLDKWDMAKQEITLDGNVHFVIKVSPLINFKGEIVGNFFVAVDVSEELLQKRKLLATILATSGLILILSFLVLYYSYGTLVQKIVLLNQSLEKSNMALEDRVLERTVKLRESENRFRSIVESLEKIELGLIIINSDYTVKFMNKVLVDSFGNQTGTFCYEVFGYSGTPCPHCRIDSVINENEIVHYRQTLPNNKTYDIVATPIINNDKTVSKLEIVRDITSQVEQEQLNLSDTRKEEQLRNLESLKTMAGAIAHRFNNAMMVVQGNLELITHTLPADSDDCRMASAAKQAARGASQVGSMMLSYVGQQPLKLQEIPLATLVRECVTSLENLLQPSIFLQLTPPDQPSYCSIDPQQIKEVIESIFTNAVESLDDNGGSIEITFGTDYFTTNSFPIPFQNNNLLDDTYTFCQIKDSGHGITPKNLSRIFEPFYSTRFVGRGLGLALTVGIMQSHHGALTVESIPGQGTTVRLLLPTVSSTQQVIPADDSQGMAIQLSGNILLADDDELVIDVASKMLELLGFTVHTVMDGQKAVNKIRANDIHFCAAVLDISMPVMDGLEAMKVIKKSNPTLPIVLSSGYSEDAFSFIKGEGNKPDGFLSKPFILSDIQSTLEKVLFCC